MSNRKTIKVYQTKIVSQHIMIPGPSLLANCNTQVLIHELIELITVISSKSREQ